MTPPGAGAEGSPVKPPRTPPKIMVAGVGNIFLSDDGFGVEVATRLAREELPPGVEVVDVGIRGMHLAYQLLDGYDVLILVDTTQRGGPPGTLYVIEPDMAKTVGNDPGIDRPLVDAHGMEPDTVFALLGSLRRGVGLEDSSVGRILVVGCEPASMDDGMGLTPQVAAAVDGAVRTVVDLVRELQTETGEGDSDDQTIRAGGAAGGRGDGGGAVTAGRGAVPEDSGDVTAEVGGAR
ncbi:MAG TPA: hydrogenase maturation protease [Cryptosporangiaceae bacterium]|nr:hydrogenase maturation protease [Cryptosporangiaceae bacterium]